MKIKAITTIALIGAVYVFMINIMTDVGMFENVSNLISLGWESDFGESYTIFIDSTLFVVSIPYYVCFFLFYTAFMWKIRNCANKWVGNTAFAMWCLLISFIMIGVVTNIYIVSHFDSDTIMPKSYREEYERSGYLILFFLRSSLWLTMQLVVRVLSCLAFIIVFISLLKKNTAIGIAGIVAMSLDIMSNFAGYISLPHFNLISNLGWIALFAIALWEMQKTSDSSDCIYVE